MDDIEVRIVELKPMRVASVWGFGEQPEDIAYEKLEIWARPKGLLEDREKHRIFGFDNPVPHPGSPNYGYEVWIEVGPDEEPTDDVRILDFHGGLYAVTRCEVLAGQYEVITATWKRLVAWREKSEYKFGQTQWLEQNVASSKPGVEFILDLYLPIAE